MLRVTNSLEEVEMYLTAPLYIYHYPKEKLSLFDKLLFTSIYGLTKNKGTTQLTDSYFMELLGKSDKTIAKSMKRLDDIGLIQRETFFNHKTSKRNRTIRLVKRSDEVIHAPMEIYLLDITDGAKMLLIQLVGLSKQEGYVYASNKALAEKMNVSTPMIYRYLKVLKEKNLTYVENEGTPQKKIYINEDLSNDELVLESGDSFMDNIPEWKDDMRLFL